MEEKWKNKEHLLYQILLPFDSFGMLLAQSCLNPHESTCFTHKYHHVKLQNPALFQAIRLSPISSLKVSMIAS